MTAEQPGSSAARDSEGDARRAEPAGGLTARASRKRRTIAEAAGRVFIRAGFAGASVDEIAAEAGVSKPTIYAHFGSKEQLFREMLAAILQEALADMPEPLDAPLGVSGDLRLELVDYARRWLAILLRPQILALRRLVMGEVERFPDLGRVWYEAGPGRVDRALALQFERLMRSGALRAADPALAAQHFGHLVAGPPQTLLLFRARDALSEPEVEEYIAAGVAAFLAAYGAPGS